MNRAVFLDRDGVINRAIMREGRPYPPASLEEFELLPGVGEAIAALRAAGYRVIVVTNQPDVAAGLRTREAVEAIHRHLRGTLAIDDLRVCYHVDADECACRKPKAGLLLEAARQWSLDLRQSVMVGDRWRDIAAGQAAGCRTILIAAAYRERQAESPDAVVNSLAEAAQLILSSWHGHELTRSGAWTA
ncbi:MAG: HAD family hydrolase [Candidatus Omnitrophica bacterium]|nr:HAD family hydrolase [Candidatus Omnitrophota bacterium]